MIRGRVKSRLSAGVGEDMAMAIYEKLMKDTIKATEGLNADIRLLFSDRVDFSIRREEGDLSRGLQSGEGLGERMLNAFAEGFNSGYRHICLAGTDCYGINTDIFRHAFELLNQKDFVIGPANDGGYYLIGMNFLFAALFTGKKWSTPSVLESTLNDISGEGYSYSMLPQKVDIDSKDDLDQLNIDPNIFLKNES